MRGKVSYVRKPLAKRSFVSVGLALGAAGMFGAAMFLSVSQQGHGGMNIGALGVTSMVFSVFGIWYGFLSFAEKDKNYILARMGIGIGGVLLLIWLLLIMIGVRR